MATLPSEYRGAFQVVVVESYTKSRQVLVLLFSEISHRVSADVLEVIRIAAAFYYVAVESMDRFLGEKVLSDVKNISTLVAVFRELERFAFWSS